MGPWLFRQQALQQGRQGVDILNADRLITGLAALGDTNSVFSYPELFCQEINEVFIGLIVCGRIMAADFV